jgi:Dolichyl-phosphate-mannose-protein mannosyltransferase
MTGQDAAVPPANLSGARRLMAFVLLALALVCAGAGQTFFAAGHAALLGAQQDLVAKRNLGLLFYGLMVVPMVALCLLQRRWHRPGWPLSRGLAVCLLLALIAVGAWFRFHRLHELPPGCWDDEGMNGIAAVKIANGLGPQVVSPDDPRAGLAAGYIDLAALAFRLFDPNDGPYTLRAVAAVLGIIGCAALAATAWVMFGRRTALIATAWVCTAHYHVNYSRIGWEQITSSVAETLLVLGLVIGFSSRGWKSWAGIVGAGLMAGLGLYSYQNYRLFVVLAGAVALYLALTRFAAVRRHERPLIVAGGLALIVAFPMLRYAVNDWQNFSSRARDTSVFSDSDWPAQLETSIESSLLAFQFIGDENPRHNLRYRPLLGFIPAMLAPIGLIIFLCRSDRLLYALVPLWFLIGIAPGAVTHEAPHASRLLDAIVPIALMIGVAGDFFCGTLQAVLPRRHLGLALGLVAVIAAAAVSARREYNVYFVQRQKQPEFYAAFLPYEAVPGRYLERHYPNEPVYLDPKTRWSPTTRFIARRFFSDPTRAIRMLRPMNTFQPADPVDGGAFYLLTAPYGSLLSTLQLLFPYATAEVLRDPWGRVNLTVLHASAEDRNRARRALADGTLRWPHGLLGRYYRGADDRGQPYYENVVPFFFCDYDISEEPIGPFGFASWQGYIDLPRAGDYFFRLNPDSTSLTIGDQEILHDPGSSATGGANFARATLPAGLLPIRITYRHQRDMPYFLTLHWQPPQEGPDWVPSDALYPPRPSECRAVYPPGEPPEETSCVTPIALDDAVGLPQSLPEREAVQTQSAGPLFGPPMTPMWPSGPFQ